MAGGECKYNCRSASETQEWINAIINFITPYTSFLQAHVVNFFKDELWESVDKDWIASLRDEPVDNLLQIPSGLVQDHWPTSLKDFILTLRSLKLPREQADLKKVLPDVQMTPLNNVLTQGMNWKKKHEIEALSAAVSSIARSVGANTIIDVGAGQGYLAQALTFQYQLSVIAIDACSHHGRITDARAERIKKHYAAKMRKSRLGDRDLSVPKTVTCRVLSSDTLKALSNSLLQKDDVVEPNLTTKSVGEHSQRGLCERKEPSLSYEGQASSLLLAGLHACGDLSVTMLRTFSECKEVKAVVSIGCCYNLLSEEGDENTGAQCGFPISKGVKVAGLSLGKSLRDLACQSAERWRGLGKDAGLHNFELHVFRAAFQMVLFRYYPEILMTSPTIGRQGKALRRKQQQGILESTMKSAETLTSKNKGSTWDSDAFFQGVSLNESSKSEKTEYADRFLLFEKFCQSGLCRLGVQNSRDIDFAGIWKETEPFSELIGPYWTLRASLGPVLETLLLLDRLLFLQEQGNSLEAVILPIFDPTLSPRNMALIAKKI